MLSGIWLTDWLIGLLIDWLIDWLAFWQNFWLVNLLAFLIAVYIYLAGILSGYVDVAVHDKVWVEIHLGLIDKNWDILLAEVCYKGRLSYNMNIVKVKVASPTTWTLSR